MESSWKVSAIELFDFFDRFLLNRHAWRKFFKIGARARRERERERKRVRKRESDNANNNSGEVERKTRVRCVEERERKRERERRVREKGEERMEGPTIRNGKKEMRKRKKNSKEERVKMKSWKIRGNVLKIALATGTRENKEYEKPRKRSTNAF